MEHAPAGRVSALANQEPGVLERLGLTRAEADAYLWAVEPAGVKYRGARAVARIARELGGGYALLGRLWLLPGAGGLYRFAAGRRSFLSRLWGDPPPYG